MIESIDGIKVGSWVTWGQEIGIWKVYGIISSPNGPMLQIAKPGLLTSALASACRLVPRPLEKEKW